MTAIGGRRMRAPTILASLALLATTAGCGATEPRAEDQLDGTWIGGSRFTGQITIRISRDDGHRVEGAGEAFVPPDTREDTAESYPFTIRTGAHDRARHVLTLDLGATHIGPASLRCDLQGAPSIACQGDLRWNLGGGVAHVEPMTFDRLVLP